MSLTQQAASGAKWTGISSAAIAVVQFSQVVVLARFLRPEDFGLMAMIVVVLGFAEAFTDMGVSAAIIHRQDTTPEQLSSLYWLNVAFGLIVFFFVLLATPAIVWVFREPRLTELLPFAALIFLMQPIGQQFHVLLEKSLRFKILAAIDTPAAIAGSAVAVWLAVDGMGVWALIWGQLAHIFLRALSLLVVGASKWRPQFRFRSADLRGYIAFGLFQVGERGINFFNRRLDQLLVGLLLGAELLGFYTLALNLVVQPMQRINPVLTRVAFPVFARVQDDRQLLRRGYFALQRILSFINFPIVLGLLAVSSVFVPVILGEKWLPALPIIHILVFVALLRSVGNPVGSLLLAKGRADLGFYWNAGVLLVQIPSVFVGAILGGVRGVAIALLCANILFTIGAYIFLIRPILGRCLKEIIGSITPALVTSAMMGIIVFSTTAFVQSATLLNLFLETLLGVIIFGVLNWYLFREHTSALWRLVFPKG